MSSYVMHVGVGWCVVCKYVFIIINMVSKDVFVIIVIIKHKTSSRIGLVWLCGGCIHTHKLQQEEGLKLPF